VCAQSGLTRGDYPLLRSPLCPDASPLTLLSSLQRFAALRTVYIADLDALSGHAAQWPTIARLAAEHAPITFWVDAGFADARGLCALPSLPNLLPVIASETWRDAAPDIGLASRCVLSLDQRGDERTGIGALGPGDIHESASVRVILMCLDRMGSPLGPDLARLTEAHARAPSVQWILAGGIRGPEDVDRAGRLGACAVLASTALHRGDLAPG